MRLQPAYSSSVSLLLLAGLTSASPVTSITTTTEAITPSSRPTASPSPAFDPSSWIPISTIVPSDLPNPNLRHREVVDNPAAAQPAPSPTQLSPVTTLMEWRTVGPGIPAQPVQVVYSQEFSAVPDQWEGPKQGEVGLGTIQGSVGVVKTNNKVRREAEAMPTALAMAAEVERRHARPQPEPFVILPPGEEDSNLHRRELDKRKGGKGNIGDATGAAIRLALDAGPPTLALLIAVGAAMVL